jgi:mannosyltransferase OCH1-like enzyme
MSNIVQGMWVGQSLSIMEKLSIRSYIENGHEYHLYLYDDIAGAPPKTVLKDANEILPSSAIFQYGEHKSYAIFADYFRYKLLFEKGGWWSDLDFICLKPLNFNTDYVFATQKDERGADVVTNGIIKAPRGADIMRDAWSICCSKQPQEVRWGETGPELMQELVKKFSLSAYVKNAATFCPIPTTRFYEAILPGRWAEFDERTYTAHLWNEMWRRLAVDKNGSYASNCLYERLKNTYL